MQGHRWKFLQIPYPSILLPRASPCYKTIETLTDCYCNPHKITQINTVYTDLLKMKINCETTENLSKGTKVNLSVHISGMWFGESSYGPYFNIIAINVIEVPKKEFMFLDDSDDESSYVKVI